MRWFKHDSDAHRDVKIRKLRRQHGLEAVGLYWTLIEMIVADIDVDRFTFELEQDAELIADDVGLSRDHVENIMRTMIELELFECSNGVVTCFKLLRRMDSSQVKNPQLRQLITSSKENALEQGHDRVMTGSWQGHDRTEQNRTDKNRTEGEGGNLPSSCRTPAAPKIPYSKIVDLYHERLPELPRCAKLTDARKGTIRQRHQNDLPDLDNWTNFFEYVRLSPFLMGQRPGKEGKPPFRATLEWLTKQSNYVRVLEGVYH